MLVFSLLAKGAEKLDQAKENLLERRFAERGCSKNDMTCRLQLMRQRAEELRRKTDEQERRAQEAWKAKEKRHSDASSPSGTGQNSHIWSATHRKA
jgi:hypothetical protein